MGGEGELYRYKRELSYIKDFPGADIERTVIKIAITKQDIKLLETIARGYVFDSENRTWTPLTKAMASGELMNIEKIGGTTLTGRDITGDLAKLQNLNITIAALRDALKGADAKDFSTLETGILTQLDITLSDLRLAIRGADTKDFSTLESQFAPDASGLPKNLKDFYLKAVDTTIESGHTWYIATGEEFACISMTNNGRIWNEGTVFSIDGVYDGTGIYDGGGEYK